MPGLKRFAKYSVVGFTTFLFDMAMLIAAVSLGAPYYLAVGGAFLIAVSVNYAISRHFVFNGTTRLWHHGFAYFIALAVGGAFLTTGLVVFLVEALALHYLTGRVIVGVIVSLIFYFINLKYNFKIVV